MENLANSLTPTCLIFPGPDPNIFQPTRPRTQYQMGQEVLIFRLISPHVSIFGSLSAVLTISNGIALTNKIHYFVPLTQIGSLS